jgi:hypothetical protein
MLREWLIFQCRHVDILGRSLGRSQRTLVHLDVVPMVIALTRRGTWGNAIDDNFQRQFARAKYT